MRFARGRAASAEFLGVHHHPIFPIDTVAVRPATRRRSGGTSSSLIPHLDDIDAEPQIFECVGKFILRALLKARLAVQ